jgi:hypothetical protein
VGCNLVDWVYVWLEPTASVKQAKQVPLVAGKPTLCLLDDKVTYLAMAEAFSRGAVTVATRPNKALRCAGGGPLRVTARSVRATAILPQADFVVFPAKLAFLA